MSNKQLSDIQREAIRLMNLAGTVGRHMAKKVGITHQAYSDIKKGRKPFSDTQARAIVRAFGVFAKTVTPFRSYAQLGN